MRSIMMLSICGLFWSTSSAHADFIFDLKGQGGVFDGNTVVNFANNIANNGDAVGAITGTFTAVGGNLNSNSNDFGIDAPGGDDADAIEAGEQLTISFNTNVLFTGLDLQDFTGTDSMNLTIGANPVQNLTDNGSTDVFAFASSNFVAAGQTVVFAPNTGDFSLSTFTVTSVPEPSPMFSAFLIGACVAGRRRKPSV